MKRLTALPPEARRYDPAKLRAEQARLAAGRKNTAIVHRKLVLAVAMKIRRELKMGVAL